jgi:hypothetical protein
MENIVRVHKSDISVGKNSAVLALLLVLAGPAWSADDPGARAVQQLQLQRQQQQDQLQLEMQQSQLNSMNPPADARQGQATQQLELDQSLRQQQLQMDQQRALQARPDLLPDGLGTRAAQAPIEQQRARQDSQRQLQQFDVELQNQAETARMNNERRTLPGVRRPGEGLLMPGP